MKYILMLILLAGIVNHTRAQTSTRLEDFNKEVQKSLEFLKIPGDCKSLAFMIKIEADSTKVSAVSLSDGLDSETKGLFVERLKDLNTTSLLAYIKEKNMGFVVFLMPIYYLTNSKGCLTPKIEWESIIRLNKFNGEDFIGNCIWLHSLSMKFTIERN